MHRRPRRTGAHQGLPVRTRAKGIATGEYEASSSNTVCGSQNGIVGAAAEGHRLQLNRASSPLDLDEQASPSPVLYGGADESNLPTENRARRNPPKEFGKRIRLYVRREG